MPPPRCLPADAAEAVDAYAYCHAVPPLTSASGRAAACRSPRPTTAALQVTHNHVPADEPHVVEDANAECDHGPQVDIQPQQIADPGEHRRECGIHDEAR